MAKKGIYLVGENLRDERLPQAVKAHLKDLEFIVVHDVSCPDIDADIILPMAGVLEKGGKYAQKSVQPILTPPKEARSVTWLLTELSKMMGMELMDIEENSPKQDHPKWIQWKIPEVKDYSCEKTDKDYPFVIVSKQKLKPYFNGPLLPKEYLLFSDSNAQVEINPSDGFTNGFLPDELIRIVTHKGEWKAKIKMNPSVPSGMLVVSEDIKADGLSAKIEKLNGWD